MSKGLRGELRVTGYKRSRALVEREGLPRSRMNQAVAVGERQWRAREMVQCQAREEEGRGGDGGRQKLKHAVVQQAQVNEKLG